MKDWRALFSTSRLRVVLPCDPLRPSVARRPHRPRAPGGPRQSFNRRRTVSYTPRYSRFVRPAVNFFSNLLYTDVPVRCFRLSPLGGHQRPSWKATPPTPPSIHPHSSTIEPSPLPEQFRALMRLLAHSVVVCTSTAPAVESRPASPRAMTMSSFTSLALRPAPAVTFNIATPSRTFDAVEASRRFNVHILADGPSGAGVADWFTRGNDAGARVFDELSRCGSELAKTSSGADTLGETVAEPPVLQGEGVLYVLRCKLLDEPSGGLVRVKDHVVVLGEVLEIIEGSGKGGKDGRDDCFGLVYADRKYRQLGNTLIKTDGEDFS